MGRAHVLGRRACERAWVVMGKARTTRETRSSICACAAARQKCEPSAVSHAYKQENGRSKRALCSQQRCQTCSAWSSSESSSSSS